MLLDLAIAGECLLVSCLRLRIWVGFGVGVILGVAAGEAVIAGGPDAPAAPGVAVPVGGREDGAGAVPPGEGDADWTVAGAVGGAPSPGGIWVEAGDAVVVAHAASVTTTDMTRRDRGPRRRRTGRGSGVIVQGTSSAGDRFRDRSHLARWYPPRPPRRVAACEGSLTRRACERRGRGAAGSRGPDRTGWEGRPTSRPPPARRSRRPGRPRRSQARRSRRTRSSPGRRA